MQRSEPGVADVMVDVGTELKISYMRNWTKEQGGEGEGEGNREAMWEIGNEKGKERGKGRRRGIRYLLSKNIKTTTVPLVTAYFFRELSWHH